MCEAIRVAATVATAVVPVFTHTHSMHSNKLYFCAEKLYYSYVGRDGCSVRVCNYISVFTSLFSFRRFEIESFSVDFVWDVIVYNNNYHVWRIFPLAHTLFSLSHFHSRRLQSALCRWALLWCSRCDKTLHVPPFQSSAEHRRSGTRAACLNVDPTRQVRERKSKSIKGSKERCVLFCAVQCEPFVCRWLELDNFFMLCHSWSLLLLNLLPVCIAIRPKSRFPLPLALRCNSHFCASFVPFVHLLFGRSVCLRLIKRISRNPTFCRSPERAFKIFRHFCTHCGHCCEHCICA